MNNPHAETEKQEAKEVLQKNQPPKKCTDCGAPLKKVFFQTLHKKGCKYRHTMSNKQLAALNRLGL